MESGSKICAVASQVLDYKDFLELLAPDFLALSPEDRQAHCNRYTLAENFQGEFVKRKLISFQDSTFLCQLATKYSVEDFITKTKQWVLW
ncbi:MAG: hypothetical protein ACOYXT_00420 [Bacteroidota bacterium]